MPACVIFDVDIRDMNKHQAFMTGVKPALQTAYPRRGAAHLVAVEGA